MEAILFLYILPILVGVLLALCCYLLMKRFPTALPWPLFLFIVLLGGAACNTAAVWYTGARAIFSGSGGFLGDNFAALLNGFVLALASLAGLAVSFTTLKLRNGKTPSPLAAWGWSWLLSQSVLNILVFLLGQLPFQVFPDRNGLPLWAYLLIMTVAIPALGAFFGSRWGKGHGPLIPLLGLAALSVLGSFLAFMMLRTAHDPAWGLSLMQIRAGILYSRLCLPSAILLGDYQYRWAITPGKVYLLTLAPHVLFAVGYLAPGLLQRGTRHVQPHPEN